jgi:DNA polymerase (family X)
MKTTKDMSNLQIARLLRAISAALSLSEQDNRFRIIAYDRAADAIEHSSSEVKDLWDDGKLSTLPGIGEGIASSLDELFRTGKVRHFTDILKPYPEGLFELLEVPGIGPKTAYKLTKSLGITKAHSAISTLEKAAKGGQIRELEGFGEDSEADIIKSIAQYRNRSTRMLLPKAQAIAASVISWLQKIPQVQKVDYLGSLRRQASTVGDIDIAVASKDAPAVIGHFVRYPKKIRVLEAGDRTASLVLPDDVQIDLMVQPPASYGSLLQHFTGSKFHNIALREFALKKGLSLSEYGIKKNTSELLRFPTEEKFYNFLGLDYIPPELREGRGEIEAARLHHLPKLVELKDIKGDLQVHSDIDVEPSHDLGESSLAQIAQFAIRAGYEYVGLTEHNPSVSNHSPSKIYDLVKHKSEIIEQFNQNMKQKGENRFRFFNGLEIDIQPDGSRALPDQALELLDYACIALHSSFNLSRDAMTHRVLCALDHPKVRYLAHPTGRLLGQREGVELDWDAIFDFCLTQHKWLEIDAWPNRLDLPDSLVHEAVKKGVKLVIDTDGHAADHLSYMNFGVSVARRGWATAADIINTQTMKEIHSLLKGGE